MLSLISIRNYILIEELNLEFSNGLNVFTGETGAGKSILTGAISLILGGKTKSDIVRKGADKASVTAIFELSESQNALTIKQLEELGAEFSNNELILRRDITVKGKSIPYINGVRCTLSQLKIIGALLVDLHGQHDHQALLNKSSHLNFIDSFITDKSVLHSYKKEWSFYCGLKNKEEKLLLQEKEYRQKNDYLNFVKIELDKADIVKDEDSLIKDQLKKSENSEKISTLNSKMIELFDNQDSSLSSKLTSLLEHTNNMSVLDTAYEKYSENLIIASETINELESKIIEDSQSSGEEIVELDRLNLRLSKIEELKRKYGRNLSELIQYRDEISSDLDTGELLDTEIKETQEKILKSFSLITKIGQKLSKQRISAANMLDKSVTSKIVTLGISDGEFKTSLEKLHEAGSNGLDSIEFLIKTNLGEDFHSLAKTASGGEISRIMLAIKSSATDTNQTPVMIFDEIDSGIGGETAHSVGAEMKSLSAKAQILCITHLQQIAAKAKTHYLVAKSNKENRSTTSISSLNKENRINELARMTGASSSDDAKRLVSDFLHS